VTGSDRRRQKAIERQDRGYPAQMGAVPLVEDDLWISQFEAAEILDIAMLRIGLLIQIDRLEPVHNSAGQGGVTRSSVARELARRADAGFLKRVRNSVSDFARSLARSI